MQQIPPLPETPAEMPDLGPSKRLRRRRRQPNMWLRRAVFVGLLCGVTAAVGTGLAHVAKAVLPPAKIGLAANLPGSVNVLVVAVDPTPLPIQTGDKATRMVADSLHLISFDNKRNRAFVLSIPRQTFVLLGAAGSGPISDALALGGIETLRDSVESVTGLTVHHHVTVELDGLKDVVKELGETQVYLPTPVKAADKASGLSLDLKEGWTQLTPEQALAWAWLRPEGDELVRLERQQMLMHRFQERAQDMWAWWWLPGVVGRSQGAVSTDMPKRDYDALVSAIAKVDPEEMTYAILPGEVSPAGAWVPAAKRWEALSARLFVAPEAKTVKELKPSIEILYNDMGDEKVMELATKLSEKGFQVLRTARFQVPQTETRIIDRAKIEVRSQAVIDELDQAVRNARVVVAGDEVNPYGVQYTIELGKAYFRQ